MNLLRQLLRSPVLTAVLFVFLFLSAAFISLSIEVYSAADRTAGILENRFFRDRISEQRLEYRFPQVHCEGERICESDRTRFGYCSKSSFSGLYEWQLPRTQDTFEF